VHLTPANKTNFTGIVLDWAPMGVSVKENAENSGISVYPNLTTGMVNIDFKDEVPGCLINVYDQSGALVYNEAVKQGITGIKTLDLSKYSNGIYFINIQKDTQSELLKYKVVLNK
jgi:hypothetical protein